MQALSFLVCCVYFYHSAQCLTQNRLWQLFVDRKWKYVNKEGTFSSETLPRRYWTTNHNSAFTSAKIQYVREHRETSSTQHNVKKCLREVSKLEDGIDQEYEGRNSYYFFIPQTFIKHDYSTRKWKIRGPFRDMQVGQNGYIRGIFGR